MKRKAIGKKRRERRRRMRAYALERIPRYHVCSPRTIHGTKRTRLETITVGGGEGRGKENSEDYEGRKRRRKDGGESKREEEERWVIIGEESGASRSITTWHQANYRLLINMLTASFLLFPSFPLLFYTDRREPQKLQAPSTRRTAYRNCFHKSNKFLSCSLNDRFLSSPP